ncbi:hypothetical protein PPIS_b0762 [Pseudoalteromonas piscicida]|uniref:Uncharacterized protein n=1 Tax=Pseudoalteromonas piscicida TaxID=43662 RepID=A0ABM6NLF9_PSEO7|nr:hypothetical protein PPIS_b0762 [Pseudoalteromonas piscicida]
MEVNSTQLALKLAARKALINRLDNYIASKSLLSADSFSLYSSYTTIIQSGELYLVKKM